MRDNEYIAKTDSELCNATKVRLTTVSLDMTGDISVQGPTVPSVFPSGVGATTGVDSSSSSSSQSVHDNGSVRKVVKR